MKIVFSNTRIKNGEMNDIRRVAIDRFNDIFLLRSIPIYRLEKQMIGEGCYIGHYQLVHQGAFDHPIFPLEVEWGVTITLNLLLVIQTYLEEEYD